MPNALFGYYISVISYISQFIPSLIEVRVFLARLDKIPNFIRNFNKFEDVCKYTLSIQYTRADAPLLVVYYNQQKKVEVYPMKKILPLFVLMLGLTACGTATQKDSYEQISMYDGLARMASEEGFVLLDVRTAEEFAAGHIPGAMNVANEVIGSEEIPELPVKDQKIYVYCRSGNRSKQAAAKLVKLGYTNITEIGGIIDYHGELE